MTEERRAEAVDDGSHQRDPVHRRAREGLDRVIDMLETVVRALPVLVPDPADGAAWVQFDEATSDLHRALAALGQIDPGVATRTVAEPAAGRA